MIKYKVQDHPNLVRDARSKAIISEDRKGLEKYLAERDYRMSLQGNNQNLQVEINTLKNEITELKNIVQQLIRER